MKKNSKQNQGKEPTRSVKTPQPPQVIDPSKSPERDDSNAESPNGKIKRKESASADRELAPGEEL